VWGGHRSAHCVRLSRAPEHRACIPPHGMLQSERGSQAIAHPAPPACAINNGVVVTGLSKAIEASIGMRQLGCNCGLQVCQPQEDLSPEI
jgi:hypothetical protein